MEMFFKMAAGLLLLQAFHLASAQMSTKSPSRTIPQEWYRGPSKNELTPEDKEQILGTEMGADAGSDNSGIASGSMAVFNEEEENVVKQNKNEKASDDQTDVTTSEPHETANATVFPIITTTESTNSGQVNEKEVTVNSTTTPDISTTHPKKHHHTKHPSVKNSTGPSHDSNHTDVHLTTLAPEANATEESTTNLNGDTRLRNATESNITMIETTAMTPEMKETPAASPSPTAFPTETTATETSPATTTTTTTTAAAAAPKTPEKANNTDKASASGSNSERGLASDTSHSKRRGAWAAILGTAVVVALLALVAYVILKNKHKKDFYHRKLVEEFPSEPVHRLDNSAPLDLNFGGSAYYNPGLQEDSIQMSHFPGRR